MIDYLRYAGRIVNLEYHYFMYEAKKRSQREMIDLLFDKVWCFVEMIDIWKELFETMWW